MKYTVAALQSYILNIVLFRISKQIVILGPRNIKLSTKNSLHKCKMSIVHVTEFSYKHLVVS